MRSNLDRRIWNHDRGLAYVRCSKDEQEGSTQGQIRLIQTGLSEHGLTLLVPPFTDDGRRGSDEERPGLLALMEYCRAHPVRVRTGADHVPIFVQSTDRLGRFLEPMKIFSYLNELKELGYDLYSLSERLRFVGGNIGDWIQIVVRSDQATGYSVRLSHDSLRGGLQIAEQGFSAGGPAGYGYDRVVVGPDGAPRHRYVGLPGKRVAKYSLDGTLLTTLEPVLRKGKLVSPSLDKSNSDHVGRILGDPLKVKAVRRLFYLYIEERIGLRSIADMLNREEYPAPRCSRWYVSAVRSILINPIYMGAAVYGRRCKSKYHEFSVEKVGDGARYSIQKKEIFRKNVFWKAIEECIVVHEAHPAIVSKETWDLAQKILASKVDSTLPKRSGRGARSNYLLTGLAKCSSCGYNYQGDTHRRTGWRSYQCGGYAAGGRSVCKRAMVPADGVERWIREEMQNRILDGRARLFDDYADFEKAIARELASSWPVPASQETDKKFLEAALAEKRNRMDLILKGLSADNLDVANEWIRTLKKEMASLEIEIRRFKEVGQPRSGLDPKAMAKEAASQLWNLKEVLAKGSIQEQRRIIDSFVKGMRMNGREGWVEATFYEDSRFPGGTFCMAPPTGFEPVSRP